MHGGAVGSGAPLGNRNAWRHGRYTRDAREQRALLRLMAVADAALMADLRIIDVVARGAVEEYDAVVRRAAEQQQRLHATVAVVRKRASYSSELQALLAELDVLLAWPEVLA